jgi:hypothetical protein
VGAVGTVCAVSGAVSAVSAVSTVSLLIRNTSPGSEGVRSLGGEGDVSEASV